jgi:hypothetical protein
MFIIDNKFKLGQMVYLKTDIDHIKRIVTQIVVEETGLRYMLSCGVLFSFHYETEIEETSIYEEAK